MRRRRHRCCRGAAAVEAALLLPLLMLLALPAADLARALQARLILDAISREGASRIMGSNAGPVLLEQHRWLGSGHTTAAAAAGCAGWNGAGRCVQPGAVALDAGAAPGDGEVVHAFEAHYRFRPWFGALLPGLDADIHVLTLF